MVFGIATNVVPAEEKWVADEIFMQMSEMRKDIRQLQQQVALLEEKLAERETKLAPISLNGSEKMTLGKQDAALAIVEFSDYECPYCAKHYRNVLPKLKERFIDRGTVKYVLKDFPLDFHEYAKPASLAARCAGEQGQYWAMHDAVFANKGEASDEVIVAVSREKKLDLAALKKCLDDPKQASDVEKDIALGTQLGVQGTPAFIVGRVKGNFVVDYKKLDGVQSFETFAGMIESLNKK
jgi:protein-disulfide isomerase